MTDATKTEPIGWGQLGLLNGKTYLRENYNRCPYPPPSDVIRNLQLVPFYDQSAIDAAVLAAVAERDAEIERLRTELTTRRTSGAASDRLHNLCEGLAEDRAKADQWTVTALEEADAANVRKQQEIERLQKLITAHNSDCDSVCAGRQEAGRCDGYLCRGRLCADCPQGDKIDTAIKGATDAMPEYPPLPEWGPTLEFSRLAIDRFIYSQEPTGESAEEFRAGLAAVISEALATERARIEREVMPTLNSLIPLLRFSEAGRVHDEILRAIRGEKEPT